METFDMCAQPIVLAPYEVRWQAEFGRIRDAIVQALGDRTTRIKHVGSTAVEGLDAKPILDIDVVISTSQNLNDVIADLGKLGYEHQGDLGIVGRDAFCRRDAYVPATQPLQNWMEHHLYVCRDGGEELGRHIKFRDALRQNVRVRDTYANLKRELAQTYSTDRARYTAGKSEFINWVLSQSLNSVTHADPF